MTDLKWELIKRFTSWNDVEAGQYRVEWVMSTELTQVKTSTAFILARGGVNVTCIDKACDYPLEVDEQDEFYEDKSITYPEIETIFVVEGSL
jgi:hypothetical protein